MIGPYRAVFVDLDGTLVSPRSPISPRNAACIRALRDRGVAVVFATGRPIESVRALAGALHDADPVISLGGSLIHASLFGPVIHTHSLSRETLQGLLQYCEAMPGVENVLLDEERGFHARHDGPVLRDFAGMYAKEAMFFDADRLPDAPILSVMIHARKDRDRLHERLKERFGEELHMTYFCDYPWIKLSRPGAHKGAALTMVCRHLGIGREQAIAIGDGANDLEMITEAGLGIAVLDADEELKARADMIAPDHREDGVAVVLEEIFGL